MNTTKGKATASTSESSVDNYLKILLSNTHFRPQTMLNTSQTSIDQTIERIHFGRQNLIYYPESNFSFKTRPEARVDRNQKCLLDNLWISYNKTPRDVSYFLAVMNALAQYFTEKNLTNKFKFYVIIQGRTPGIYQTWIQVIDAIKGFKDPLYKGFNNFHEALDYARGNLGPNFYVVPELQNQTKIPQYNIQKDTNKIIFCDHCTSMTENFRRLNHKNEILEKERNELIRQNMILQDYIRDIEKTQEQASFSNTATQTSFQPQDFQPQVSSPSPLKMDQMGVHSPENVRIF